MRAWIENVVKKACEEKLAGIITHFDRKVSIMQKQVDKVNSIDTTILAMKEEELGKFITNRLVVFESSIDDKIVGLYRMVDEKIHNGNGNVKTSASLLRRIALLEGITDAKEHRRSTEELLERLEGYKKTLLELDRTDSNYSRYEDAITLIQWVLGETTVGEKNA